MDDLDALEDWAGALLAKLQPAERRAVAVLAAGDRPEDRSRDRGRAGDGDPDRVGGLARQRRPGRHG